MIYMLLLLIAISAVIYFTIEKNINNFKNPFFIMANAFFVSIIVILIINITLDTGLQEIFSAFNFATLTVAVGWSLYNVSLLFAYKNGAKVSSIYNIILALTSVVVIIVGLMVLNETYEIINYIGLAFTMLGVYFLVFRNKSEEDMNEE